MVDRQPGLLELLGKTAVVHTVTYFVMGALASTLLNYEIRFAQPEMLCWMRPFGDPWITAGPLLQPIRGVVFGLAFYPLREVIFPRKNGWLIVGWLLVALGILSTFGPAPGSIEGLIYTQIPLLDQITGWLEVMPQALLLAFILHYWVRRPEKRWLTWGLLALLLIAILLLTMGLLLG